MQSTTGSRSGPRAPPRSPVPHPKGGSSTRVSPTSQSQAQGRPPSPLPPPAPDARMTTISASSSSSLLSPSPAAASTTRSSRGVQQPQSQSQQSHSQSPPPGTPSTAGSGGGGGRNVRVVARIRPPTELELMKAGGDFICLSVPSPQTVEITLSEESGAMGESAQAFTFDRVFDPMEGQEAVFDDVARPIVDDVLQGYNGTIFAYGQTSSGKTYTMEGASPTDLEERGIIPRAVSLLFETIANADPALEFTLKVSIVEIYMERIRDLLDPFKTKTNLQVREDARGQVYIAGVTEAYVTSEAELLGLMLEGQKNRAVAATGMNEGSSRSHSVFMLTVHQRDTTALAVGRSSKLVLVDLAGSEMVRKTGAAGQQLEEAKTINKSLSALGLVITALTEGKGHGQGRAGAGGAHVPYRDSKLTRVLQDALGGNSKLALIINLSPSPWNATETLSTLRFGSRAKGIQNRAVVNETRSPEEMALMLAKAEKELYAQHAVIQSLEAQLKRYRKGACGGMHTMISTLALGTTMGSTTLLTSRRPSLSHTQRAALMLASAAAADSQLMGIEGEGGDGGEQRNPESASEAERAETAALTSATAAQTMATAREPDPEKDGSDLRDIPTAPTTEAEADEGVIVLLKKQLAEARAELAEEREEGRRREEENRALAQIARDETAALAEARAAIQGLEGALRVAKQEAEEASAKHAFELEQARLHAQRCEGEQARLSGELEEMGKRLAAAATLAATAAAMSAKEREAEKGEERLAAAVGHVAVLQEKLEALVQTHRLLVRKHRGVEGELSEARAQVGLRDERIQQLEGAQGALELALRRQEERHMTELAALREQALRVAGVLVLPSPGREGGDGAGAGGGESGSDLRQMASTSSFGVFDEGNGTSPRRSMAISSAAAAAALLGSTLGLRTSLGMSISGPRTIRGGTKAAMTPRELSAAGSGGGAGGAGGEGQSFQRTTGPLPVVVGGGEGGPEDGANGSILSRLREGILGTILASPL